MNRPRAASHAAVLAAVVLVFGLTRARAGFRVEIETVPDSGITAEVTSPFEHCPPVGSLPLTLTIRNLSGAAHTWTLRTDGSPGYGGNAGQHNISETLRVENGQTAHLPILLPLDPLPAGYYYRNVYPRLDGYGINDRPFSLPNGNPRPKGNPTASVGMGEDLATPIWASLTKWYVDKGQDLVGSPIDLDGLNGDWRSLAGFDVLWLSDTSYARLDAARRVAIRDWISGGGLLCLCMQTAADPALRAAVGLPPDKDAADVGLGSVRLVPWDGKDLSSETVAALANQPHANRADPAAATAGGWPLTGAVGTIPVNAGFLIGFILTFAVLIGPVNLFVFARSAQRHRLFWTTPLISVGASLLLMGFIMLQDGFGGSGQRALLCLILPDQRKTVVVQEQVARTGVVLSHGFDVAEDLLLFPIQIAEGAGRVYEQTGRHYDGDWFASRSVQAQRLEAILPSRAEISLVNADATHDGAPPVLASSLPGAIRRIAYRDPAGHRWIGDGLRTGERITLRADEMRVDEVEAKNLSPGGSEGLDKEVERLLGQRGSFAAMADDGPFLETLPTIRWTGQRAVFVGLVTGAR